MAVTVKVKRTDLGDENFEEKSLIIPEEFGSSVESMKKCLAENLEVRDEEAPFKVFKLRNAQGALIPLTYILKIAHPHESCQLEVTNCHQTTLVEDHVQNLTLFKNCLKKRVDHLEDQLPRVKERRDEDILKQVHELSLQLRSMSERIDLMEASSSSSALQ